MPLLFSVTLFVSATLLFLVQPMVAKMVLPSLGGTPAVWNTCMVFFQAALLAGYAYAHATTNWLSARGQVLLHAVLLALPLFVLPISIMGWAPPSESNPIPSLLLILTLSVGLPFFVLSASAPLLQKWFAETDHPSAKDPYFLYAASNVGSMLALLGYPALVEPNLHLKANKWFSVDTQSGLWSWGYALLAALMAVCGWIVWRKTGSRLTDKAKNVEKDEWNAARDSLDEARPSLLKKLHWLALAFVPSSFMLGVTTYITLDIAAIPLLWVIPLALYLLSFILVFARWPAVMHKIVIVAAPLVILLLVFVRLSDPKGIVLKISLNLLALFIVAMVCHGELARTRPATRYLTGFYLLMSLGGVLGGLFNALVAPLLFNDLYEYSLAIIMACMLLPALGAAGGTSVTVWILRRLAGRGTELSQAGRKHPPDDLQDTRIRATAVAADPHFERVPGAAGSGIGGLANNLLSFFDFIERDRLGWIIGLVFDLLFAVVLGLITLGFITFFKENSESANWFRWLPSWIARFHHWLLERIENLPEESKFTTAQFRAILTYGAPILICYSFVSRPVRFGLGVAALFLASHHAASSGITSYKVVHRERSFFGVLSVEYWKGSLGDNYRLMHGTTIHGMQIRGNGEEFEPQTYYHKTGPIGQVFEELAARLEKKNIGLIGLGSGTLACYGKPGQHLDFYDIDPKVVRIAQNPEYFTYYKNCRAEAQVILGDARLKIEAADPGKYQLIVVDAFSSDAIPIHLITREAIELYFQKLKPDGVLAVHISNRYLDLEPVLGNIAEDLQVASIREYDNETEGMPGKYSSDWVLLARKPDDFGKLLQDKRWTSTQSDHELGMKVEPTPAGAQDAGLIVHEVPSGGPAAKAGIKRDDIILRVGKEQIKGLKTLSSLLAPYGPGDELAFEVLRDGKNEKFSVKLRKVGVWTDDFSNLLSVFDWKN